MVVEHNNEIQSGSSDVRYYPESSDVIGWKDSKDIVATARRFACL